MRAAQCLCLVALPALCVAAEGSRTSSAHAAISTPTITPPPVAQSTVSELQQQPQQQRQEGPGELRIRQNNVAPAGGGIPQQQPTANPEAAVPSTVPDQWPSPMSGSIGLGTLTGSVGATKTIQARSEGTLGQMPWIGMAIGLTCTALAAVMLG